VAANGTWIGVTARTRVVAFNPKKIKEEELPKSVLDFANPEWQGKVGFVPTSGAFQEQAVAIIKLHGRDAAEEWLTGPARVRQDLHQQHGGAQSGGKRRSGDVLVNNYYWFALQKEKGQLDSNCTTSPMAMRAA
jgi:iron(III) transport system substrate-binding protein